jgi:hydrogenase maturation factor HypF (carbamoyltransferase family)
MLNFLEDIGYMLGMGTYSLRHAFMATMVVKTKAESMKVQQVTLMLQISTVDLQQYKQHCMLQQHQKRLLQAQQQQQLVIPSSATTVVEQLTPGLQNIDSLLNNTVAPNVSLQVLKSLEMLYFMFNCALPL